VILLSPEQHTEYQLIDTGGFEKLERFGPYILSRPEPQAIWDKSMTEKEWADQSNAVFKGIKILRKKDNGFLSLICRIDG
jgi:23S rRNA (cytosine1962-C5)-methyltransferase